MEERSKTNFDHPDSLETDLLIQHLQELKAGKIAVLPTYEFKTHTRTPVTTMVRFSSSSSSPMSRLHLPVRLTAEDDAVFLLLTRKNRLSILVSYKLKII